MRLNLSPKSAGVKFDVFEKHETEYCDNYFCENEAIKTVEVSVERAGDSQRKFCAPCYEAYLIGVQHGRISENPMAFLRNDVCRVHSRKSRKLR